MVTCPKKKNTDANLFNGCVIFRLKSNALISQIALERNLWKILSLIFIFLHTHKPWQEIRVFLQALTVLLEIGIELLSTLCFTLSGPKDLYTACNDLNHCTVCHKLALCSQTSDLRHELWSTMQLNLTKTTERDHLINHSWFLIYVPFRGIFTRSRLYYNN